MAHFCLVPIRSSASQEAVVKLALALAVAGGAGYYLDGTTGAGWSVVIVGGLWLLASVIDFPGNSL